MAFRLKYELLCKSKINGNAYKLKLLFDGYEGDPINRNMPGDSALVIRKDKAAVIRGTSLDFGIREAVDFEMDEFYTNNSKKIKVELYKDTTLLWTGYNLSQQYQAPYIPAPVSIRFTATDGLGLLKSEKFTLTAGLHSQLATIIYCVDKIGLALGYSIAINLFATAHDHDRSPLAQTYEDSSIFTGMDCYTVLEKILNKYDAEITQVNVRWHITRSVDKKSTRMLYTTDGVYETTAAAPAVLNLGYPNTAGVDVWPVGTLSRSIEPGGKKVKITHDFGLKNSILINSDFLLYTSGTFNQWQEYDPWGIFENWSQTGDFIPLQGFNDLGAYMILPQFGENEYMSQSIDLVADAGQDFVFAINLGSVWHNPDGTYSPNPIPFKMLVSLTSGEDVRYLTTEGWTSTLAYLAWDIISGASPIPLFIERSVIADPIPFSGTLEVKLFRAEQWLPDLGAEFFLAYQNARAFFISDGMSVPSGLATTAEFTDSTEPNDLTDIKILAADAPDIANASIMYKNITRYSDGTPTT